MSIKNIHFILVRPQIGENIGSVARAIKNFNISKLRIVNPRCKWPNERANATSVGAKNLIDKAKVFSSVSESVGDLDIIFASSSTLFSIRFLYYDLKKKINKSKKIGIMFGPEASGLSNDDVNYADYIVKIPTNKNFSSINLSHSAVIFCFQLFKYFSREKINYKTNYKSALASKSEVKKFLNFIIKGLDKKGFLQPNHKRQSMIRNISNIFYRLNLSEQEIRILLGVFATLNEFNRKS